MIVPATRRALRGAESSEILTDTAWQDLDAAFREWASAPTGERYRALLDADRRWREAVGPHRIRPRPST